MTQTLTIFSRSYILPGITWWVLLLPIPNTQAIHLPFPKPIQILLDRFDYHQKAAAGDVSIQELQNVLQPDNLSYLTSTGITFTSQSWGAVTNVLVRSFTLEGDYYIDASRTPFL